MRSHDILLNFLIVLFARPPGRLATGATREETERDLLEAIQLRPDSLREDFLPISRPRDAELAASSHFQHDDDPICVLGSGRQVQ